MNVEAMASQACLIHDAFEFDNVKELDQRMQQVYNDFLKINPDIANDILKLNQEINKPSPKLTQLQKEFFSIFSKAIPDLDKRIQHHDQFMSAFRKACASKSKNFEDLEQMIKEHQIDLSAFRIYKGDTLLDYACYSDNYHVVKFLLEHGVKVEPKDMKAVNHILFNSKAEITNIQRQLMLEQMIDAGCDVNFPDLLNSAGYKGLENIIQSLIFHGATPSENLLNDISRNVGLNAMIEAMQVRSQVQSGQKKSTALSSVADRKDLAKQCYKRAILLDIWEIDRVINKTNRNPTSRHKALNKLRDLLSEESVKVDLTTVDEFDKLLASKYEMVLKKYEKIIPDLSNQIKRQNQFIQACTTNNLDDAEKILKEGVIDINECLVPTPNGKSLYPLLHHAIFSGNEKLMDLLLRAGADINYFSPCNASQKDRWYPVYIDVACRDISDKAKIMERLKQAGADINFRDSMGRSLMVAKLKDFLPISNEILEKRLQTELLDLQTLKKMHADVLNIVGGYVQPTLEGLPGLAEDAIKDLQYFIAQGLDIGAMTELCKDLISIYEKATPSDHNQRILFYLITYLIFNGADINSKDVFEHTSSLWGIRTVILEAIIMRDNMVAEYAKKSLVDVGELSTLASDIIKKTDREKLKLTFKELPSEFQHEITRRCLEAYEKQKSELNAQVEKQVQQEIKNKEEQDRQRDFYMHQRGGRFRPRSGMG